MSGTIELSTGKELHAAEDFGDHKVRKSDRNIKIPGMSKGSPNTPLLNNQSESNNESPAKNLNMLEGEGGENIKALREKLAGTLKTRRTVPFIQINNLTEISINKGNSQSETIVSFQNTENYRTQDVDTADGLKYGHSRDTWATTGSTLASLYATLLVCIYVAFMFTEIVRFPQQNNWLEMNGFLVYLYLVSIIYLGYFLVYLLTVPKNIVNLEESEFENNLKVHENTESHGSLAVRIGCIIFGFGTISYYVMEFLKFAETIKYSNGPCFHVAFGVNAVLAIIFTILQAYTIFMYPRFNIHCHPWWNKFGTFHLVATNIIIWIRILIEESFEEMIEFANEDNIRFRKLTGGMGSNNSLTLILNKLEEETDVCKTFRKDLIGRAFHDAIPFIYPFVIEYALIGASVALIMSYHIGAHKYQVNDNFVGNNKEDEGYKKRKIIKYRKSGTQSITHNRNDIAKPNPKTFMKKLNCANSFKGIFFGLLLLLVSIINLAIFYGLKQHSHTKDEAELVSKLSNTIMNTVGIIACLIGLKAIRKLSHKTHDLMEEENEVYNLDDTLLRFGVIFVFIYNTFTVITGSFMTDDLDFPYQVNIVNGIVEIVQVFLQIVFIHNLMDKVLPQEMKSEMPGRQICMFMFIFNISQWLVFTFEIQKVRASLLEAAFYGFMPWVIIRRVTLPLVVFFRFHSAVVSIELWKRQYKNN